MVEFKKGQKYFGTCFASRKVAQTFACKNDKMFYITLNTVWKHGFHSTLACTFERLRSLAYTTFNMSMVLKFSMKER